jgi:hypothetical protein
MMIVVTLFGLASDNTLRNVHVWLTSNNQYRFESGSNKNKNGVWDNYIIIETTNARLAIRKSASTKSACN